MKLQIIKNNEIEIVILNDITGHWIKNENY